MPFGCTLYAMCWPDHCELIALARKYPAETPEQLLCRLNSVDYAAEPDYAGVEYMLYIDGENVVQHELITVAQREQIKHLLESSETPLELEFDVELRSGEQRKIILPFKKKTSGGYKPEMYWSSKVQRHYWNQLYTHYNKASAMASLLKKHTAEASRPDDQQDTQTKRVRSDPTETQ